LAAAQRAVEAAPSNHMAYCSLAQALFFHKEIEGFRNAADRAVALNSMDRHSIAFLGEMLTYRGDPERGLRTARGGRCRKAVQELLRVRPDFAAAGRRDIEKWWEAEYVERLIEGWRKAGLKMAPADTVATRP